MYSAARLHFFIAKWNVYDNSICIYTVEKYKTIYLELPRNSNVYTI